jgi:hypothetical protein
MGVPQVVEPDHRHRCGTHDLAERTRDVVRVDMTAVVRRERQPPTVMPGGSDLASSGLLDTLPRERLDDARPDVERARAREVLVPSSRGTPPTTVSARRILTWPDSRSTSLGR